MIKLSKYQLSALSGMVLGDGYLQKIGKKNARLRLEHAERYKDYILWKMSLLPRLFQGRPKVIERIHPQTKKKYFFVRAQSNSSPLLGKLRKIFYPEGKKVIPEITEKLLKHPIGFVIWYYDDGSWYERDKISYLSLGVIDEKSVLNAKNVWEKLLKSNIIVKDKKEKGFEIIFNKEASNNLSKILYWYQFESLIYKIPKLAP